jgi:hypothetical protein
MVGENGLLEDLLVYVSDARDLVIAYSTLNSNHK